MVMTRNTFQKRWMEFLKNYEKKFIHTVPKVGPALEKEFGSEQAKSFVLTLYQAVFMSNDLDLSQLEKWFKKAEEKDIDLKYILAKAFLIMIRDFSEKVFYKDRDISSIKYVVNLMDTVLNVCKETEEEEIGDKEKILKRLLAHSSKKPDFDHVDTGSEEYKDIIATLSKIRTSGSQPRLYNIYKGLPVSYPATIVLLDKEGVLLEVHPNQLGVISIDRFTILKHPSLGEKNLVAEAKSINIDLKRVKLWKFFWVGKQDDQRKHVRVKPRDIIEVLVTTEGGVKFKGYLIDISVSSFSLLSLKKSIPIDEGSKVFIQFSIPEIDEFYLSGEVLSIKGREFGTVIAARFSELDTPDEKKISSYVTARQKDILKELQNYVKDYLS